MNISSHFDYNNHIISTHMKCTANGSEFDDLAFLNVGYVAATFRQCLSPIGSKLSTREKKLNLGKASW